MQSDFDRLLKTCSILARINITEDVLDYYYQAFEGRHTEAANVISGYIQRNKWPSVNDIKAAIGMICSIDIDEKATLLANKLWKAIGDLGGYAKEAQLVEYFGEDDYNIVRSYNLWPNICMVLNSDEYFFKRSFVGFYRSLSLSGCGMNTHEKIQGGGGQISFGVQGITAPSED